MQLHGVHRKTQEHSSVYEQDEYQHLGKDSILRPLVSYFVVCRIVLMGYCLSSRLQPTGTNELELGEELEVHPLTCHEGPEEEYTYSSTLS
jgi:hypothetical protein